MVNNYYNKNAAAFVDNTFSVNMESIYQPFLYYLPDHGKILDVGCGSGRDSLYFKNRGFAVDAFDYSSELVKLATEKTGLPIQQLSFYDLDVINQYDGIWACASLLHCERNRLPEVLRKLINALKVNGVCYLSFKYGDRDRTQEGRNFTDLNEKLAHQLLSPLTDILLLQQWLTIDNRPDRKDAWLNIIIRKEAP